MADRGLILLAVAAVGALALLAYTRYRARPAGGPEWLNLADFDLELMSSCCAFVVFTTPSCRPCRVLLKVLDGVAQDSAEGTEVVTVDATERADLARRYSVKTVPTTFLITASGHVIARWIDVPAKDEVAGALAAV